MTEDTTHADTDAVVSAIRSARLVYGGVLVDDQPQLIEYVDDDAFDEGGAAVARYTAYNNIGADLVPIVHEADTDRDDEHSALAATDADDGSDPPQITTVDRAASAVADAQAYYVLVNTADETWRRLRNVVSDRFAADGPIDDPETGRYVLASALVDDATAHIAELPAGVDPEEVVLIDWSS